MRADVTLIGAAENSGRRAGFLYLVLAVTGGFSMLYVPSLIVAGDAAATVANIRNHEVLFRLGVLSGLVSQVLFVFLALSLYRLFKHVDATLATTMVALVVAAVPVAFLNMLNQLAALHILGGAAYLSVFSPDQTNALVLLFLDLHSQGLLIVGVFWGLWLLPLGLLVMKSRVIPAFVGVLLIVACVGYLIDVVMRLLSPDNAAVVTAISSVLKIGELVMIFWLLIRGVKTQPEPGSAIPSSA